MELPFPPERVRVLNTATVRAGKRFVLYWMQASHRTEENPALAYACARANALGLPLLTAFLLDPAYPEANLRSFQFMLQGLIGVGKNLENLGSGFALLQSGTLPGLLDLSRDAALLVTDRGYLREQEARYHRVAEACRCPVVQVEGNVVVPVDTASAKEEYSAATFRPKVTRQMDRFLVSFPPPGLLRSLHDTDPAVPGYESADAVLAGLPVDRSVPPSPIWRGGEAEAARRFSAFLEHGLDRYMENHNDPALDGSSGMSPYLHFGQVSPSLLVRRALEHGGPGTAAFVEELLVRRELAVNFVRYNPHYDGPACLPSWAKATLDRHRSDQRVYVYTPEELEQARTHDPYWNAAQMEMMKTGKMQGYLRMYWGKKILEWSGSWEEAYHTALVLNNRYEIDGRDPNGFAGVAWCFGKHDRPWGEREIFGTVRYMNAAGLRRKFRMDRYLERVQSA